MKRDTDLIRDILLKIEGGRQVFETLSSEEAPLLGIPLATPMSPEEARSLIYHLDLLDQEGTIEIEMRSLGGAYMIKGLTRRGHDYLDSIRNPEIWQKAKSGAATSLADAVQKADILKVLGLSGSTTVETSSPPQPKEMLTLKPAFMGMSVDLKELFLRAKEWLGYKK